MVPSSNPHSGRIRSSLRTPESSWAILLYGLCCLSLLVLVWQSTVGESDRLGALKIDRLSAFLTFLVGGVGAVVFRFSERLIDECESKERFLRWLAFTVIAAYVLMLAGNLLLLVVAWSLVSVGLHELLTHYSNRPEALRPARKKFLISRLGDVALITALIVSWKTWGTWDLDLLSAKAIAEPEAVATRSMAFLIVIASLTKSAQFPFHSWLPETMEAPTPVSALMHAGIINAGGALVLRFASLLAAVPESLFLLSLVGTLTMVLGTLSMWAQVKVERTLAWSTVNQMGFMMVQLGVGAFSAAAIHIFGHGCYKAWSFLRSSELPQPSVSKEPVTPRLQLTLVALGVGQSLVWIIRATTWTTGFEPVRQLGEFALLAIVALSVGHAWAVYLGPRLQAGRLNFTRVLQCIILSVGAVGVLLGLYHAADWYFAPVWGQAKSVKNPWMWLAAGLPVMASLLLTIIHAHLPTLGANSVGRKLFIHSLHGFYLGAVADRIVDRIWNNLPFTKSLNHASSSR